MDEPVNLPITDTLDLHTFHPGEIPSVVEEYLRECVRLGYKEVRIIHGKGKSFQKFRVKKILENHPCVSEYYDAPPERGSWGATIVHLTNDMKG